MNANSGIFTNKAAKIALLLFVSTVAGSFTGCKTTDYRAATLYKNDEKTPNAFERLSISSDRPTQYFNGNLIQVPPGQLAQFDLKELKIGILADKDTVFQAFPKTRTLPERMLWVVVQIEAFKSDDFLRTASKRSFFASAVKQNQNGEGYVALDSSESSFALQTADWQYEVTFTLYSVDNFKLKQAIGFIAKDNEGLLKIGYDALKQFGGATYSFVADPLLRLAKHEFGDAFLFERALLTAGAVTEFKGMVYVIRPINAGNSANGEYALADLSDVPGWESLKSLERNYLRVPANAYEKEKFLLFRDPVYREAYSTTLAAINRPVLDKDLRAKEANFLMFKLSTRPDENRRESGVQQRVYPHEEEVRKLNLSIADSIKTSANQVSEATSAVKRLQEAAQYIAAKIRKADPANLKNIAGYKIDAVAKKATSEIRSLAATSLSLSDPEESVLESGAAKWLSNLGIVYTDETSTPAIVTDQKPPKVIVGADTEPRPTPDFILEQLTKLDTSAREALPVMDKYRAEIEKLQQTTNVQSYKANTNLIQVLGDLDAVKKEGQFKDILASHLKFKFTPDALLNELAITLQKRAEEEKEMEKIRNDTDSQVESKTKIF